MNWVLVILGGAAGAACRNGADRMANSYLGSSLLGTFSVNNQEYKSRSPINNIDQINSRVIIFHGLKDKVVGLEQVKIMVSKLKANNIPVEFFSYKDEGHGFRDSSVNIEVLELTEKFFLKYLGL